ncbi:MAG TPA: alpha-amylase family glycosyl hydrolase, partial [Kofleriaceae bacterium]|nr:alpha-amylase family glycosyl hydrolase [Kofleriaceae bacterium]
MRSSVGLGAAVAVSLGACVRSPAAPTFDASVANVDAAADAALPSPASWRSQVIYLAMVDRFRDGDPSNNDATGCYAPTDPQRRHGGDFEGLRQHLDYIRDIGATAVWITPPNVQAGPTG